MQQIFCCETCRIRLCNNLYIHYVLLWVYVHTNIWLLLPLFSSDKLTAVNIYNTWHKLCEFESADNCLGLDRCQQREISFLNVRGSCGGSARWMQWFDWQGRYCPLGPVGCNREWGEIIAAIIPPVGGGLGGGLWGEGGRWQKQLPWEGGGGWVQWSFQG